MRKKQLLFLGIVIVSFLLIRVHQAVRQNATIRVEDELIREFHYHLYKVNFTNHNHFENHLTLIPHDLFDRVEETAIGERDFTFSFVYDIEEITNPTEDMIIFFPTEMTLGRVELINYGIRSTEVDATEFSLTYPVTLEDFVYNWEDVRDLSSYVLRSNHVNFHDDTTGISLLSSDYQARRLEELNLTEEDERLYHLLSYGQGMWFGHNQEMRFMDMRREIESSDHSFSEIVFVHSEEEASGFTSDVIAFFPTQETIIALELLNWFIENNEQYLAITVELGLDSNFTIEDIVNDGEEISLFWQGLAPWRRTNIQRTVLNESAN